MINRLRKFSQDESGAVTVDWVVLSAVIVGFAVGTVQAVRTGSVEGANAIALQVSAQTDLLPQ